MRRLAAQAKAEAQVARQRRAAAAAQRARTGQPRRGKAPPPVVESPDARAQRNFTDPELHIMRTNTKGWDYCGHAHASVDATCQLILACDVSDASNAKQQAEPLAQATLATLAQAGMERPQGEAHALPATLDSGSDRETAVGGFGRERVGPYIPAESQRHPTPPA